MLTYQQCPTPFVQNWRLEEPNCSSIMNSYARLSARNLSLKQAKKIVQHKFVISSKNVLKCLFDLLCLVLFIYLFVLALRNATQLCFIAFPGLSIWRVCFDAKAFPLCVDSSVYCVQGYRSRWAGDVWSAPHKLLGQNWKQTHTIWSRQTWTWGLMTPKASSWILMPSAQFPAQTEGSQNPVVILGGWRDLKKTRGITPNKKSADSSVVSFWTFLRSGRARRNTGHNSFQKWKPEPSLVGFCQDAPLGWLPGWQAYQNVLKIHHITYSCAVPCEQHWVTVIDVSSRSIFPFTPTKTHAEVILNRFVLGEWWAIVVSQEIPAKLCKFMSVKHYAVKSTRFVCEGRSKNSIHLGVVSWAGLRSWARKMSPTWSMHSPGSAVRSLVSQTSNLGNGSTDANPQPRLQPSTLPEPREQSGSSRIFWKKQLDGWSSGSEVISCFSG